MSNGKKALVIFVPFRLHKRFQKIQARLVPELEKKFSGTPVVIIAQRTILSKTVRLRSFLFSFRCFWPSTLID